MSEKEKLYKTIRYIILIVFGLWFLEGTIQLVHAVLMRTM